MKAARKVSYYQGNDTTSSPIIDLDWRNQPSRSRKEFMDELAQRVGRHYGMADIRDAQ